MSSKSVNEQNSQAENVSPDDQKVLLADILTQEGISFSEEESLTIILHLAESLKTRHDAGEIHPDLRPENIGLASDDSFHIIGWGNEQDKTTLQELPTPYLDYASPEQQEGQAINEKSNIYSLGVLLYALIAGHAPKMLTTDWDIFDKQNEAKMEPLEVVYPQLSAKTAHIVRTCLWRQPWSRYDYVDELIADVSNALRAEPSRHDLNPISKGVNFSFITNRKVQYGAAAVLGLIALIALFSMIRAGRQDGNTAVSPTAIATIPVVINEEEGVATETAVSDPDSASIQIEIVAPVAETKFAQSDTATFQWNWEKPLADGQQFVISIYQNNELKARTAVTNSQNGTQYEWEIPIADFIEGVGIYHWQLELQLEGIDTNIRETLLTPFEILANTPTPTLTHTPTITPSPTETSTPTPTPTPICVPTAPAGWIRYTIKTNDILFNLALQTGTTVELVEEANCLETTTLTAGDTLFLPPFLATNTPIPPTAPPAAPTNPPSQPQPTSPPSQPQPTSPPPPPRPSSTPPAP